MSRAYDPGTLPDLAGKTAVITGANSGIGYYTALWLGRRGAAVTLACRNRAKADKALADLTAAAPDGSFAVADLDLADLGSVAAFAAAWGEDPLDILVLNAGVMALPYGETKDGFERQFGINHLGHFALTGRLIPALRAAPAARVVVVSSLLHRRGRLDFDDLQGKKDYGRWRSYRDSKFANMVYALELDARLVAAGTSIRALAAHPGYAATNLPFPASEETGSRLGRAWSVASNALLAQPAEHGAWPTLYAAAHPAATGGELYGPAGFYELWGPPKKVGYNPRAAEPETRRRLWEESERLTGVGYGLG